MSRHLTPKTLGFAFLAGFAALLAASGMARGFAFAMALWALPPAALVGLAVGAALAARAAFRRAAS